VSLEHPLAERYLSRLDEQLKDLAPAERREVVDEIRNHIADATRAGKPLDSVLQALGSADELARGYAVELLLHPRAPSSTGKQRTERFLALTGLVVVGSIPTLVIVVVLASVGVSFFGSGLVVFAAGILASVGWLPNEVRMDVAPIWAILLGPLLVAGGALSLAALVWYVRFLARVVRRVLPAPAR